MHKSAKPQSKQERGHMLWWLCLPRYKRAKISQNAPIKAGIAPREPKTPWILGFFIGFGVFFAALFRVITHFGRKNIPLALGIVLFVTLFLFVAYNAFFHQSPVSRPVLFSTRADISALKETNGQQKRIFVKKALTTEALEADRNHFSVKFSNIAEKDVIGAFIANYGRKFTFVEGRDKADYTVPHPTEPAFGKIKIRREQQPYSPAKLVVPKARPDAGSKGLKKTENSKYTRAKPSNRAQILRVQKALQRAGQTGIIANGVWDIKTRAAVCHFQERHALKPTGQIDSALIAALKMRYLW